MQNVSNDKAKEILEKIGLLETTKLEKLANSFSDVKYEINPDKHNPDTGSINFIYSPPGQYYRKRTSKEIAEIAEKFYDKNDYIVISTEIENGFGIIIWDNFITKSFSSS
ncbi:MAG TPA: hypothetical protein PLE51_03040 [Candidatus Pacearchaeota archaeon]|nr:hypothetical protein [Candidatus Pacearchaeota archaeon]HOR52613.1 hypothetical protein [Candidatus Pacearchaeota archaeon]HOU79393.1 hypothetical protein [Candidatus Pacearchaeota archaeon]HPJ87029.1 hypothetical protein [Candidatus Pacearchaeota archaeon]HQF83046.1 hypothetical protein [Candidatus Pacearchaeota archaeon]